MKKVCVSVINDLATDQRVIKVCDFLTRLGFSVKLIGIKKKDSGPVSHIKAEVVRLDLWAKKGFLFYAEYNLRLFFVLLFSPCRLFVSNDLDTLLPNYLVSKLKFAPLIYDSHEYYLGSTEITNRKLVRIVWKTIERLIFPRLKHVITVNHSIADLYEKDYQKRPHVVRNLPHRYRKDLSVSRKQLGLPTEKKIIIMQGGAINVDRGAEELIAAMKPQYGLDDVELYFIGSGDVWEKIKQLTRELHLDRKVHFLPRMPYSNMMKYTGLCDIGITLDKPVSLNYKYSLPNKLFDYLSAGIPVLASPMVEVKKIVEGYDVGMCINSHEPEHIAAMIKEMLSDDNRLARWRSNAEKISKELCWENEEKVLIKIYEKFV